MSRISTVLTKLPRSCLWRCDHFVEFHAMILCMFRWIQHQVTLEELPRSKYHQQNLFVAGRHLVQSPQHLLYTLVLFPVPDVFSSLSISNIMTFNIIWELAFTNEVSRDLLALEQRQCIKYCECIKHCECKWGKGKRAGGWECYLSCIFSLSHACIHYMHSLWGPLYTTFALTGKNFIVNGINVNLIWLVFNKKP